MNNISPKGKTILLSVILSLAIVAVIGFNLSRGALQSVMAQQASTHNAAEQPEFVGPPEPAGEKPVIQGPNYGSSAMAIVKMLGALALVVVCIYFGLHLLKKTMGRMQRNNGRTKMIEVLETQYVGPKKAVSLIRVGNRAVLLGVTDSNINVLTELQPEELTFQGATEIQIVPGPSKMNFATSLKKAAGETLKQFRLKRAAVGTQ